MMSLPLGTIIELLVAVLLLVTIAYCWILNNRLQRLRADEETLRATISELMTATEIAERAILGLKSTATEADKTLGSRLNEAEKMSRELAEQVDEGEKIFNKISQIAEAARGGAAQRAAAPRREMRQDMEQDYAPQTQAQPQAQAPVQAPAVHVEPARARGSRADEIRNAAAEATARLERFRRRSEGAAA
ncbi:DUF6468 domain-containing protein [Roseibium sediminis]|uniref:DUF6468 domain-containing protein n=1 Tax=Roseibium sediminis TaxID=1775174 RepID=UPI00123D7E2F|nr:DUF6468 domain-containing protein [Roseibium sediminis]